MNVLSVFDGMSCGQLALERAKVYVENYFASEIDKAAITVTQHNFPNTIQLGNVERVCCIDLPEIHLLIGGSPCQGFSFAGKGLNFDDPRSKLFFEFVRLKKEINPKYFLLENVGMLKKYQDVISEYLGCEPIFINSRLVSAQDRKRLYWTNIPYYGLPKDKNIGWNDITSDPGSFAASMRGRRIKNGKRADYDKTIPIVQHIECRMDNKTNCLTTVGKDNVVVFEKAARKPLQGVKYRYLTRNELERLQTLPDNYTLPVSYSKANHMIGNGWTVDVIAHLFTPLSNQI